MAFTLEAAEKSRLKCCLFAFYSVQFVLVVKMFMDQYKEYIRG